MTGAPQYVARDISLMSNDKTFTVSRLSKGRKVAEMIHIHGEVSPLKIRSGEMYVKN